MKDKLERVCEQLRNKATVLYLSGEEIGRENIEKLADALKSNKTLTSLTISNSGIDDEGAKKIVESLKSSTNLAYLNLAFNKISDKGAQYIAGFLSSSATISSINLHANKIKDEGFKALDASIELNKNVVKAGYTGMSQVVLELLKKRLAHATNLANAWINYQGKNKGPISESYNKDLRLYESAVRYVLAHELNRPDIADSFIPKVNIADPTQEDDPALQTIVAAPLPTGKITNSLPKNRNPITNRALLLGLLLVVCCTVCTSYALRTSTAFPKKILPAVVLGVGLSGMALCYLLRSPSPPESTREV